MNPLPFPTNQSKARRFALTLRALGFDGSGRMDAPGVGYRSGHFVYRQFRCQQIEDAFNVAERKGVDVEAMAGIGVQPVWLPLPGPTHGDWTVLKELGIHFDGLRHHLHEYCHDRFQDAINQARVMREAR